ncbi:Crp/Fnr family transcriptional regulator [Chryseobacterium indoltheticum]|uniref:cAMP regulatory protein n=1 Tax=Chryseobacterium indoltheticum TaxID=254 RepID=A0A381FQ92_9FLAO|nr:Crp/Fnr family transcriptional regulator [Chryseobacterium indoltheticum]SUX48715.1 cAMP regulatory protein [Chryseobacterium indoltheticum]
MVLREDLLVSFGADIITLNQTDLLFEENAPPEYYFQIMEGQLKLTNFKAGDGEFIQSLHNKGESVGEVFLFCKHHRYPANAVATKESKILRLEHSKFIKLLQSDFDIQLEFLRHCAQRTYYSYVVLNSLTSEDATHQLLTVLNHLKEELNLTERYSFKIPYTRKELSSLTGLRIETVIRIFKKLEAERLVEIIKGKVYY